MSGLGTREHRNTSIASDDSVVAGAGPTATSSYGNAGLTRPRRRPVQSPSHTHKPKALDGGRENTDGRVQEISSRPRRPGQQVRHSARNPTAGKNRTTNSYSYREGWAVKVLDRVIIVGLCGAALAFLISLF